MTIKHRLKEYRWVRESIKELEDRIIELDTTLQKVTSEMSADKVQVSYEPDKWTDLIAEKLKLEKKINSKVLKSYEEMHYIEDMIDGLGQREKLLMRYRYIHCKKWEEICVLMGYEWRQVHNIHSDILKQLSKKSA